MPLTDFQARVARLLAANRTEDSYLAGAAAILIEPNRTRYSRDLHYFHDSESRVATAFDADRTLLEHESFDVEVDLNQPGCIRAIVTRANDAAKVEWARDSSWRFMPTGKDDRVGFVLHPVDLAVNQVLALAGRDEPRDLLDIVHLHRDVLVLGALCWAACGKDPGFSPISILELLRRRGRVRPEDLAHLDLAQEVDLADLKRRWLAALEDVEPFARSRPARELGCLYSSPGHRALVDPRVADDAAPHFGRPGGVVPQVCG